jgi:hypothetical protein
MGSIPNSNYVKFCLRLAWVAVSDGSDVQAMYFCKEAATQVVRLCSPDEGEVTPYHVSAGSWWGLYYDTREEIVNIVQSMKGPTCN